MKSYKAYCFDLDGTVYRGMEPIEEARQFIRELQTNGVEPFYVTNNAMFTEHQVQSKLAEMGIQAESSHIITSAIASAKYIAAHYPNAKVKVIGGAGLKAALLAEKIELVKEYPDLIIQGIDMEITYQILAAACYDLANGATFIATNGDLKLPTERGFAPGNGSLVELIHTVTGVNPIYIGKPAPHMLGIIQQEFQLAKEDMLMIGDNYDTDIMAGIDFGIDTAHVNTGVTPTDIVKLQAEQPTYLLETLADLGK